MAVNFGNRAGLESYEQTPRRGEVGEWAPQRERLPREEAQVVGRKTLDFCAANSAGVDYPVTEAMLRQREALRQMSERLDQANVSADAALVQANRKAFGLWRGKR